MKKSITSRNVEKVAVKRTTRNWVMLVIATVLVLAVNVILYVSNNQEVEIAVLKNNLGQGALITPDSFTKDTMVKKEYRKQGIIEVYSGFKRRSVILWEDVPTIKTAYSAHYIKGGVPVHWDSLTTETGKDYAYLYQMEGELLKINLDGGEFGAMLMPGDRINVRASFLETDYRLPSDSEYAVMAQSGGSNSKGVMVKKKLFDNVTVLDILNKNGESIFDLYYHLLTLSTAEQQQIINSAEFKTMVAPVDILLNVTAEEADEYMTVIGKNPSYLMTVLPRTSENVITEALQQLLN